jgi:hypothetical protein
MPLISDTQRAQSIATGTHLHQESLNIPASTSSDLGLGSFDPFVGSDDLSQGLLPQHSMGSSLLGMQPGYGISQPQPQGQMGAFQTGQDFLAADVNLSRYAQQRQTERRLSDAALPQQTYPDFGMAANAPNYGTFGAHSFDPSTGSGPINLPFEVDASFGNMISGPAVNAYPQLQQHHNTTFDDSHLFMQQPGGDHTFSNIGSFPPEAFTGNGGGSYGINQFMPNTQNQSQQLSQPQTQTQNLTTSQPNSRRGSMYGYQ